MENTRTSDNLLSQTVTDMVKEVVLNETVPQQLTLQITENTVNKMVGEVAEEWLGQARKEHSQNVLETCANDIQGKFRRN